MNDMKLTPAQFSALQWARRDGELQIGGLDGRPVRLDVANRLVEKGLLSVTHRAIPYEEWWCFVLTDSARRLFYAER